MVRRPISLLARPSTGRVVDQIAQTSSSNGAATHRRGWRASTSSSWGTSGLIVQGRWSALDTAAIVQDRWSEFVAAATRRRSWRAASPSSSWPCRRFCMNSRSRIAVDAVRSVRRPRTGRGLALSRPWSHSMRLSAHCVVSCSTSGSSSSTTHSNGAARSVVTSLGRSRPGSIVLEKVLAAASITGGVKPLRPPVDRRVVDVDALFGAELFDVPVRESVAEVPANGRQDRVGREPEPSERRPHTAAAAKHLGTVRPGLDRSRQQCHRGHSAGEARRLRAERRHDLECARSARWA